MALEAVNSAIEASQRIMQNLRPAILEQGLAAALQWLVGRFERRTGIEVAARLADDRLHLPRRAPGGHRTAQEGADQCLKHAGHAHRDGPSASTPAR